MTIDELRRKWSGRERFDAVGDAVRQACIEAGIPLALAEYPGRYWFSAWDAYHHPFYRAQLFEA